jgi:hypothetical protein
MYAGKLRNIRDDTRVKAARAKEFFRSLDNEPAFGLP